MFFSKKLIEWYRMHQRDLPWRETRDPYRIWLSEIILQQTRVDQGMNYYLKFTERYKDVHALANADEEEVMKMWQGLGYYSRARNLHFTAKHVSKELKGVFPGTSADLQKLKGIGPYSAAAIASFAYRESVPVIDGNVKRVLSRVFGVHDPIDSSEGEKQLQLHAEANIDPKQPDTYNQAIMEFGALQCTPRSPDCEGCPMNEICEAKKLDVVDQLPIKKKKIKTTLRWFDYFLFHHEGNLWINKREGKGIWQHLFDFPCIEHEAPFSENDLLNHSSIEHWIGHQDFSLTSISQEYRHVLSHQKLHVRFVEIQLQKTPLGLDTFEKIKLSDIQKHAVPRLVDKYLEDRIRGVQQLIL